jgi:glycosyltransferase involved in cell wall biosynthesis
MQQSLLLLAGGFAAQGTHVTLVCADAQGAMRERVPAEVEVRVLASSGILACRSLLFRAWPASRLTGLLALTLPLPQMLRRFPALVEHLRGVRPAALIAAGTQANLAAILARRITGVPERLVVSERNTLSAVVRQGVTPLRRVYPWLIHRCYPAADAIVAVSEGVAQDLVQRARLAEASVTTLYNAVDLGSFVAASTQPLSDPWLDDPSRPLILAAGRLHRQKDFPTLLRAFALVRRQVPAHLLILGEGTKRGALERLGRALGIGADLRMPGFVSNPAAWMVRAGVFVLSSAWEGLPRVLLEALAVGCPVVSTDCPSGPREILAEGRFGRLIPVGDSRAMADAILATLAKPPPRQALQARAADFSTARMLEGYRRLAMGG